MVPAPAAFHGSRSGAVPSPGEIREALTGEEIGHFDREYRQAMADAAESLDLSGVLAMLERWRRVAWSTRDNSDARRRMLQDAALLGAGQDVATVPWEQVREAMKAVVYTRYGPPGVLRLMDVETPAPRDGEVLVKVHAVSLNASDWETLRGKPLYSRIMGPFRPRHHILGSDIAGQVEAAGANATLFQPGEQVFADILSHMGGFAEYVCVPESTLARMPAGMTYEEAACLPQAGAIALQGLAGKGQVQPGQKVLINGAGGGSGMYAVQLAKLHGAEVTGVDNTEKLELMRSVGADHVIDYTREDFTRNGRTYDLILDLAAHRSAFACKRSLAPGGRYLCVGGSVPALLSVLLIGPLAGRAEGKKIRVLAVRLGVQHVGPIVEFCQAAKIATIIDRRYRLSEVPEALRYLGEGHAKGKVVVIVE